MSFLDDISDETKSLKYVEQGTEAWERIRIGRFTSSEIWKLMVNPKTKEAKEKGELSETALQYIDEKVTEVLTGQAKQQGYAFPLVYGKEKEPEAIQYFIEKTGFNYQQVGFFPLGEHAGGSPDGEIEDDGILEVKCPLDSSRQIDYFMLTDQYDLLRYSKEYYWQCMANMLFTGKSVCHFVTYDPRFTDDKFKMTHLVIKADMKAFDVITKKIEIAVEHKLKKLKYLREIV